MSRRIVICPGCGQRKPHRALGKCGACWSKDWRKQHVVTDHGYTGYTHGCRCDTCKDAKADYMAARRGAACLAGHVVADGVTHGTRSTFEEHGCRCETCVAAQVARGRASRSLLAEAGAA